ncbi:MAG: DegV family protein [Actinobacteria bacterium]|nr:MAG: DegV family protein [Actinomycetota bacterium]
MAGVAIVTDTTHYMPRDLARARGVQQVSLYVSWGEEAFRESEIADYDAFYERLRSGREMPSTSQPSIGDFLAVYEPLLEAGQDICSIHLSGGISGTFGAATQARALLEERGLSERIETIDGETACGGLAGVVLAAAAAADGGAGLATVSERARRAREALDIWFCVDTLEFLQRGGRIGRAQAWLGGALRVKPILSLGSEILPVERVRTAGRAFERMVEYMTSLHDRGADGWIVQHIQAAEQAERLVERGRELFGSEPLFVSEVGPVIGVYTGPGLLGVGGLPARFLSPAG